MEYWLSLLLLHCIHSSIIALPTSETETERKHVAESSSESEMRATTIDGDSALGVVADDIANRYQDPTENLVCRLFKMNVPRGLVMVPASSVLTIRPPLGAPASVLQEYLYSPAPYAALCVSPEKPKPYPFFFAPPPPLAAPPATPTILNPPVSKAPAVAVVPTPIVSNPISALSAPPPAISLVFSSPVGSIGVGSISTPAVNIGTQSIIDRAAQPRLLIRSVMLPFT